MAETVWTKSATLTTKTGGEIAVTCRAGLVSLRLDDDGQRAVVELDGEELTQLAFLLLEASREAT